MDDDDLIAALAGGDDTALRELFTRRAPWLAARLRKALPSQDLEDVLQRRSSPPPWTWPVRPPADRGAWIAACAVFAAGLLVFTVRGPAPASPTTGKGTRDRRRRIPGWTRPPPHRGSS